MEVLEVVQAIPRSSAAEIVVRLVILEAWFMVISPEKHNSQIIEGTDLLEISADNMLLSCSVRLAVPRC